LTFPPHGSPTSDSQAPHSGTLQKDMADALGVREGIPVAVGTNDMASAQAGAGNFEPGCIMDTAGSSDMVSILTDQPVVHPRYYLRNSAIPGLWQIYATTAGGFALDWFYGQFCGRWRPIRSTAHTWKK
jgi:xylulokinase